jgi:hypothetical protein
MIKRNDDRLLDYYEIFRLIMSETIVYLNVSSILTMDQYDHQRIISTEMILIKLEFSSHFYLVLLITEQEIYRD